MDKRIVWKKIFYLALTLLVISMSVNSIIMIQGQKDELSMGDAYPNLSFERPVDYQIANDDTNRVFVVEQAGKIHVFENTPKTQTTTIFLDITAKVSRQGNEEGLLGLAFHPDYTSNGLFYVYYSAADPRRSVIAQFEVQTNEPNKVDLDSEKIIMEIAQPLSNHNGGQIVFGPDGYLYIALGDGGGAGDPEGNGQNLSTVLGSILRIDVDKTEEGKNYSIPSDNPFVNNNEDKREEIYAYGLRNPWRISFDKETGWLWAADVGQNAWEEINIIVKGGNYGWNIKEGSYCYDPPSDCNETGLIDPIFEYSHSVGNSITGGYAYHGTLFSELRGKYIYGDYVMGQIWALEYDGVNESSNTLLVNSEKNIAAFGLDKEGEIYILAFDGNIYTFVYNGLTTEAPLAFSTSLLAVIVVVSINQKRRKTKN